MKTTFTIIEFNRIVKALRALDQPQHYETKKELQEVIKSMLFYKLIEIDFSERKRFCIYLEELLFATAEFEEGISEFQGRTVPRPK